MDRVTATFYQPRWHCLSNAELNTLCDSMSQSMIESEIKDVATSSSQKEHREAPRF
jgi:hypothetical protein